MRTEALWALSIVISSAKAPALASAITLVKKLVDSHDELLWMDGCLLVLQTCVPVRMGLDESIDSAMVDSGVNAREKNSAAQNTVLAHLQ